MYTRICYALYEYSDKYCCYVLIVSIICNIQYHIMLEIRSKTNPFMCMEINSNIKTKDANPHLWCC